MKIKIGDQYYDTEDQPVMLVLSDSDKENIAKMHPRCAKFAIFPNTLRPDQPHFMTKEQAIAWMD